MGGELRRSGIDYLGDLPWGSHFCLFYETADDLIDTLTPYFAAGLESGEFCLWAVSAPMTVQKAEAALRAAVPDFDRHLASRSIEILPVAWWLTDGRPFDPAAAAREWDRKLEDALERGFTGMRASGDAFWLDAGHRGEFRDYERYLDGSVAGRRITLLCTYALGRSWAADVLDAARTHQFTLARRRGAWEIVETPELRQAKAEIKKLNEELEQRVIERTRELAAANARLIAESADRERAERGLRAAQAEIARVARLTAAGELAALIAHEINQPLAAIAANGSAAVRWLAMDPPNLDEARTAAMRIVRDADRASEVVTRIRALMKRDFPSYAAIDINGTIREVLTLMAGTLKDHHIAVRADLAAGLPPVRGDRVQLQQVIVNLVMNAIEAMRDVEGRRREMSISSKLDEAGNVLVTVADSGSGFDPALADRLFEPFFTTKSDGMGLGLSISLSIVEGHGGRLQAVPRLPHGGVFQLTLPAAEAS